MNPFHYHVRIFIYILYIFLHSTIDSKVNMLIIYINLFKITQAAPFWIFHAKEKKMTKLHIFECFFILKEIIILCKIIKFPLICNFWLTNLISFRLFKLIVRKLKKKIKFCLNFFKTSVMVVYRRERGYCYVIPFLKNWI